MKGALLVEARGLVKGYATPAGYVPVLQGLDLDVPAGELLAIVGASGVGKSTLLHVLGTLDRPEAGQLRFEDQSVFDLGETPLRAFRNRSLGFVFQFHHLLPEFSALENVMMPLLVARQPEPDARRRASELLNELGLESRVDHRPSALSGGEQQRVAVARALACGPRLLLADEPSGNLDGENGRRLHELLRRLNRERGLTVVLVTHDHGLAASCDRAVRLIGGQLEPASSEAVTG